MGARRAPRACAPARRRDRGSKGKRGRAEGDHPACTSRLQCDNGPQRHLRGRSGRPPRPVPDLPGLHPCSREGGALSSQTERGRLRRSEEFRRYLVRHRRGRDIGRAQIRGFVRKSRGPRAAAARQWRAIHQSHGGYTRNRLHRFDHALLHSGHGIIGVTGHVQIRVHKDHVRRFKSEIAVQRAQQPAHGHHRRGDQHRTDRNLHR